MFSSVPLSKNVYSCLQPGARGDSGSDPWPSICCIGKSIFLPSLWSIGLSLSLALSRSGTWSLYASAAVVPGKGATDRSGSLSPSIPVFPTAIPFLFFGKVNPDPNHSLWDFHFNRARNLHCTCLWLHRNRVVGLRNGMKGSEFSENTKALLSTTHSRRRGRLRIPYPKVHFASLTRFG